MSGGHALLSPSAASRWLACTPSARLEQQFPDRTSEYAEEGTVAHRLAELLLRQHFGPSGKAEADELERIRESRYYTADMEEHAGLYADLVKERYAVLKTGGRYPQLAIEARVDLTGYVPECFGTVDAAILADGVLEVIDLKYGTGVKVAAENNRQMMLYAIGIIDTYGHLYKVDEVRLTVCQPRIDNISVFSLPVRQLCGWAEFELKPRAALAFRGAGEYAPGDHCRFCKAGAQCRARAEKNMELAKDDFKEAALLTPDETAEILLLAGRIKNWLTAVEEHALAAALEGEKYRGLKLVEGRSVRRYADEKAVADVLTGNGFSEQQIYERSLKTITALEKLITKKTFAALLSDYIVKPQGKPCLVPETDPRPEYNSVALDFSNIND